MLRTKKEKIEVYVPFILIIALSLLGHEGMGLYAGCGILQRMADIHWCNAQRFMRAWKIF